MMNSIKTTTSQQEMIPSATMTPSSTMIYPSELVKTKFDIKTICLQTTNRVSECCINTVNKIINFLYGNRDLIFFTGCTLPLAYFQPRIFFPTAIGAFLFRIEITRILRNLANEYMKDEKNPYKLQPHFRSPITKLDVLFTVIASANAIALSKMLIPSNEYTTYLIPGFAGLIAANVSAKLAMNWSEFLGKRPDFAIKKITNSEIDDELSSIDDDEIDTDSSRERLSPDSDDFNEEAYLSIYMHLT